MSRGFGVVRTWVSARRVRRLRARIGVNRCPAGAGITHHWVREAGMDPTSFGGVVEWWECAKCLDTRW